MHRTLLVRSALLALSLVACSDSKNTRKGPCALGELVDCGAACSATLPCNAGLFCDDGVCSAECAPGTVQRDCGGASSCAVDGRCESSGSDGGGMSESDGGFTGLDDGGAVIGSDGSVCADVTVDTSAVTPNIVFIVDQSASMNEPLGSTTRWDGLRNALLDQNGILTQFEDSVQFGFALYSGRSDEPASCPIVTQVDVAAGSVDEIRSVYQAASPIDDTPTGDSIDVVLENVRQAGFLEIDYRNPTIFILATDGAPDRCEQLDPQTDEAKAEAVTAVENAFEAGVRTYVIAVADEGAISQEHVNDLANAGVGIDASPGTLEAPSYRVNDDQGLRDALRMLVDREVTCTQTLRGVIRGDVAEDCAGGSVKLGDRMLECGVDYEIKGSSQIELIGAACDDLKAGQSLRATFPCDSVILG